MTTHHRTLLGSLSMALALAASGCADGDQTVSSEAQASEVYDTSPMYLSQGWDETTRAAFYQTSQGSRMLPYDWFLHLEKAGSSERFRNASNMRRMGFLVDEATVANPDGLPVGFARDSEPGKRDEVGLTCAACHTGELEYEGTRVRVDGGQSLADLEQLQNGLHASLTATLDEPAKFERFAAAVGRADTAALRTEMVTERDWWTRRIARSKGITPHGPSRVDAFTIIANEVACDLIGIPENCPSNNAVAPTQFPHLWGTPDFEFAQYNSSVHSPLGRNVGEVTGVFAEARFTPTGVVSSADLVGLNALEDWLRDLEAPSWPEDVFGEIDHDLAAEGEVLYAQNCASCHPSTAPTITNVYGRTMDQMNFSTPLLNFTTGQPILGTDRTAAFAFASRRAYPGPFAGIPAVAAQIGPDGKVPVFVLLSASGSMIIGRFFAVNAIPPFEQLFTWLDARAPGVVPTRAQLLTYKARPLDGIALTAPFLHNGSVPSLYELLLPPGERSTSFHIGNTEYDPEDVGYSTEVEDDGEDGSDVNTVVIDTTALGNSNAGHVYGTALTDDERYALIEYLKTL